MSSLPQPTEEEALALFECAARDLLGLSAAGFLRKYKLGEFKHIEADPKVSALAALIPAGLSKSGQTLASRL